VSLRQNAIPDAWYKLPSELRDAAESQLQPGESMLAWLEFDLDRQLHFSRGLVILTDQRLLSVSQDGEGVSIAMMATIARLAAVGR